MQKKKNTKAKKKNKISNSVCFISFKNHTKRANPRKEG